MRLKCFSLVLISILTTVSAKIDPRNLRCLVCRTTFEELNKVIKGVDKWKMVDVGNFRMDKDGNTMQQKVPAHRSEAYISELLEGVCTKMNDYVRVTYKSTGKLSIMLMVTEQGTMNPDFSKTKFVTDDDLNKSLEYYCERIFEENEEEILSLYKNRADDDVMPDVEQEICFKHAGYCDDWMLPDEQDTTWTEEMEKEYIKIHGPDPYGFGGMGGMNQPRVEEPEYDEIDDEDDENEDSAPKDEL